MFDSAALRARLTGVRDRIARAAGRVGRDPSTIRLVAVSKTFSADHVRAAADAGQLDFGENKIQEALGKMAQLGDLPIHWHLIGHLQSNKARKAAAHFDTIHSVDDAGLLAKIDESAREAGRTINLLIQVDLAGEATKHGVPPDAVLPLFERAAEYGAIRVNGLMVLPPAVSDAEAARPYFAALRTLRDALTSRGAPASMLRDLSMGMSHDFEVAIEEGATVIRVGSAIFGDRYRPDPGPVDTPHNVR